MYATPDDIAILGIKVNILAAKCFDLGFDYEAGLFMQADDELWKFWYVAKRGYNPDEPRVPVGNPDGGQWTRDLRAVGTLSTSEKGKEFIRHKEGFSSKVYRDKAGYRTIGYGHKLSSSEDYPNGISKQEAMQLFERDVSYVDETVQKYVHVDLTQYQFDALSSFIFNVGSYNFSTSTLLSLLNKGDYNGAANEFPKWNKVTVDGVKIPDKGLTRRRRAEQNLFLHNHY